MYVCTNRKNVSFSSLKTSDTRTLKSTQADLIDTRKVLVRPLVTRPSGNPVVCRSSPCRRQRVEGDSLSPIREGDMAEHAEHLGHAEHGFHDGAQFRAA